jgi:16S rRNA (cytosine967-C5)-methyltransferase
VYATCSILPEENDAIVRDFLVARPEFRLRPARDDLAANRIDLPRCGDPDDPLLRLYPHVHGTDGFFAALLERQE